MGKNSQLLFDDMTLRELLGQSLKHWRKALVVGLVLALLLSVYNFAGSYKNLPSNMTEEDVAAIEAETAALQQHVDLLTEQVAAQNDYIENSILMNINPNTMVNGAMVYYMQFQDENSVDRLKDVNYAYYAMVYSGEIAECISEKEGFSSSDYIKEIITAEINVESEVPCVAVYVKHYDEEKANQLLDAIAEVFESKQAELSATMGAFNLKEISRSVSVTSLPDLATTQAQAYTALSSLQTSLDESEAELTELTDSVTMSNLIIKTVVFFIVGFIVGFIAVVAAYMVMILASSKIKSANQLRSSYSVRVLGNFIFFDKKIQAFDKLAYKLSDERLDVPTADVAEFVKSNLGTSECGPNVLVVSLSTGAKADEVENLLRSSEQSVAFVKTGFDTAETVNAMKKVDSVAILAEKFENSIYQLDSAKLAIEENKKEFLGVILV